MALPQQSGQVIKPETIAHALGEGKEFQNGDGSWNTVCPAHNDKGPSLTVSEGNGGRLLVHCHSGCRQEDVIDALKRQDLWPRARRNWVPQKFAPANASRPGSFTHPRLGPAEKTWEYRDLEGRLVGFICRFEKVVGTKTIKELAPMCWGRDADSAKESWCWKGFVKPRPLYRGNLLKEYPEAPVLVVEGEKTTDAAQLIFGGEYLVVTWPGGSKAAKYVDWSGLAGRDVVFWPDADEPGYKAQAQVCEILKREGARTVKTVQLPAGLPEGWDLADTIPDSVGLDPIYLVRTAQLYEEQQLDLVSEYNQQFALVLVGDKTVVLWEKPDEEHPNKVDIQFMSTTAFGMLFGNRYVQMGRKEEPAPNVWMKSERRRTYHGVTFKPGSVIKRDYNLWRGFAYEPDPDGDFSLFKEHMFENVAQGDESLNNWLWAWFAQMYQQPQIKPGTSIGFRGKQGTGKTIIGKIIGALVPQHYILVDDPRYVVGQFNSHQASCLLLHADEAFFAGDPRVVGRLKGMVTSEKNRIEFKGKDSIETQNFMRLLISSNEGFIVPAAFDERRFLVQDVGEGKKQNRAYFKAMEDQLKNGGFEGLLHHLLHLDLSTVDVGVIPNTSALVDQKIHTMDAVQRFWYERLRDGEIMPRTTLGWPEKVSTEHLYQAYIKRATDWGERRRVADNQFGREIAALVPGGELKRSRMTIQQLDNLGQIQSVRTWGYELPPLKACREMFDKVLGGATAWQDDEGDQAAAISKDDGVPF